MNDLPPGWRGWWVQQWRLAWKPSLGGLLLIAALVAVLVAGIVIALNLPAQPDSGGTEQPYERDRCNNRMDC